MAEGTVIVLNGVSSAGKSSLARQLQATVDQPLFHLSLDTFEGMLGTKFLDDVPREQLRASMFWVNRGMHASARAFSLAGYHVVIDTVFERREWLVDCVQQLTGCPVLFVGVHCPPEELARRERERGDRTIGQAVGQLGHVHKHALYDLEVDTHDQGLEACAHQILAYLSDPGPCQAVQQMQAIFQNT